MQADTMLANGTTKVEAGPWAVSNAEYHADRACVSHSSLEVFMASRPLYYGIYVAGTIERKEPSDSMILGSALHLAILEPDKWETKVAVIPDGIDRRTKAGKETWAAFTEESDRKGLLVISQEQQRFTKEMAASIFSHRWAYKLLQSRGEYEKAIRWIDQETGIGVKAKFDKLCAGGVSVDLKTAADPSPRAFAKSAATFGYHRQAALYLDGALHALGVHDLEMLHIVVGTQPPYEVCCCYLDPEDVQLGREENRAALIDLKHCRDTDTWASRWASDVQRVRLPKWARYQFEREEQ